MIQIFKDGDQWCALEGQNIQDGICGFGVTQAEALRDLAQNVENDYWELSSDR